MEDEASATGVAAEGAAMHPARQAMLDGDEIDQRQDRSEAQPRNQRKSAKTHHEHEGEQEDPASLDEGQTAKRSRQRKAKPGFYDKQLAQAEQKKLEAQQRAKAAQQRQEERLRKVAERHRRRKQMSQAKYGGKNGRAKLGRESVMLLEKVKRLVGDSR
jgi:hypothetical protein